MTARKVESSSPRERDAADANRRNVTTESPPPINRLGQQTSPYLLQHANNPVAWYPWGPEAFERAQRENKPVFLSVGYSTCYWCHVMERESFEDEAVAAILNDAYVSIKVDREERPDIDEQYMLVSQWITGRGGWPNSVWLTPDGKPWMAGSYFPREHFKEVLRVLSDAWTTRRREVVEQADRLAAAVEQTSADESVAAPGRPLDQQWIDRAVAAMRADFDATYGGFGPAPKFPPHDRLGLLAHEISRTGHSHLLAMFTATLDAMARGGIHDQLGGGFHRYSTDERWLVPHFEKMLYDNAALLRAYTDGYRFTGDEAYRRVADGIAAWVARRMTDPAGGFYSALDAESEREEGKFYVWTYQEVCQWLPGPQGTLFAEVYGLSPGGNYVEQPSGRRSGVNILHLPRPVAQFALDNGLDPARLESELADGRRRLLEVRAARARPHLDDKILTAWNGLLIGALAYAGRHFHQPQYTEAAVRAAQFLLTHLSNDAGGLLRTYRAGRARLPAYLDDYALLADALLELHAATGETRWIEAAQRLADAMCVKFLDRAGGGFFFTSDEHEPLLVRSKNLIGGGNTPSANSVATQVLLRLAELRNRPDYRRTAESALNSLAGLMWHHPQATESLLLAAAMSLMPPLPRPVDHGAGDGHCATAHLSVDMFASHQAVAPGQTFHVAVVLDVDPGWHLYGPRSDATRVTPTRVSLQPHPAIERSDPVAPQGNTAFDPLLGATVETYRGQTTFLIPITVAADAPLGATTLAIDVHAQVCGPRECLSPVTATLRLPILLQWESPVDPTRHADVFHALGVGA